MGFNGSPLTYNSIFDLEKPFHRDLAMKILRAIEPKRASNNLSYIEEHVAIKMNLPSLNLPQQQIAIHEHCKQLSDQEIQNTGI